MEQNNRNTKNIANANSSHYWRQAMGIYETVQNTPAKHTRASAELKKILDKVSNVSVSLLCCD